MTLATALSLIRGVLGIFLPFLLVQSRPAFHFLAILVFMIAAVTDYYDGWVARKFDQVSDLGKIIDPTMDKVLVLAPFAIFGVMGFYSMLWVILVFAREISVTFCRIGWYLEGRAVGAEKIGKLKFVVQITALAFAAVYLLVLDYSLAGGFRAFVYYGMKISVFASVALTMVSGLSFFQANWKNFESVPFAKFVCALGVGLIPVAPGTWGSALALFLIALVFWNPYLYAAVFLFLFYIGYRAAQKIGIKDHEDPSYVVIDEACGMFIAFIAVPFSPASAAAGFFLFRLFDILKPFPVRKFEQLPGYWGIMCDDLAAGVYSCLCLHLIFIWL